MYHREAQCMLLHVWWHVYLFKTLNLFGSPFELCVRFVCAAVAWYIMTLSRGDLATSMQSCYVFIEHL